MIDDDDLRRLGAGRWLVPLVSQLLEPDRGRSPSCSPVSASMQARVTLGLEPGGLSRWSLPILVRLGEDWARFSSLRADLAPITPRALSSSLKQLIDGRLVDRRLQAGFPPSSLYGLAEPGRQLLQSLQAA